MKWEGMMKAKIAVLVVSALLVAPVAAHALEFSAGLNFGILEPDGEVQTGQALGNY